MQNCFYSVTITSPGALSAPNNGFVDDKTVPKYLVNGDPIPSLSVYTSKIRANIRYATIVQQLHLMVFCAVFDTVATGATETTEASSFAFVVKTDHGADYVSTPDEQNSGQTLTGTNAIKRCVARALILTQTVPTAEIANSSSGFGSTSVTAGPVAASISAAEGLISVSQLYVPDAMPNVFEDDTSQVGQGGGGAL